MEEEGEEEEWGPATVGGKISILSSGPESDEMSRLSPGAPSQLGPGGLQRRTKRHREGQIPVTQPCNIHRKHVQGPDSGFGQPARRRHRTVGP